MEYTGNRVLADLYRSFYEKVLASVITCVDPCHAEPGLASHRRLLEAVRDGDAGRARAEADAHLSSLLRRPPGTEVPGGAA
nr:FCD domain-containing protein [Streptomyces sp. CB02923]